MTSPRYGAPAGKLGERRLARRRILFAVWGGGCALLFAGLVAAANISALQVKDVVIEGNEVTTDEELSALVRQNVSGSYLGLFPRSNILLYPRAAIERAIEAAEPRIASAAVALSSGNTIALTVKEREPSALWCEGTYDTQEAIHDPCYFIDGDGLIYGKAPVFTGDVYIRYWGIHGGDPTGLQLLELAAYREMSYLLETLPKFSLEPTDVVFNDQNADVTVYLKGRARLLFTRKQSLGEVLENLDSVLSSEPLGGRDALELDYIDLRFGNKIYYRLK